METPIGRDLRNNTGLAAGYAALAIGAVLLQLVTLRSECVLGQWADWPPVIAAFVLLVYVLPGSVGRESLGLRPTPVQPIGYWVRFTLVVAVVMLGFLLIFAAIVAALGLELPVCRIPPSAVLGRLVCACLIAPLVEELIYRLGICVPATAILGPTGAILVSGTVFAGLHFVYGNPGPDNFVAGYILAWAYLKSGSIVVPIVLHSLGNSVVVVANVVTWYTVS